MVLLAYVAQDVDGAWRVDVLKLLSQPLRGSVQFVLLLEQRLVLLQHAIELDAHLAILLAP